MYQVVAITLDPALLSLLKHYCQQDGQSWQLRSFPTVGSYLTAPRTDTAIDLLFFDATGIVAGLEEKRLVCFMAPLALRVVVTEPQHEDVILNHLEHFHSFVGHDLSYEHLIQLFENAARLSTLPLQEVERRLIGRLTEYPVFPSICQELRELLKDPQVELVHVTSLVSRDPLIVSRLLQLVNSPYMGFASETWSLHTAINRLGFQLLQTLVLMLSVKARQAELGNAVHVAVLDDILADAGRCRELALSCGYPRTMQDQVFISAILSGFGKLVLLQNGFDIDDPALQEQVSGEGLSYLAVSAFVMTLWGFEAEIVQAILQQQKWQDGATPSQKVSRCLYLARLQKLQLLTALPDAEKKQIRAAGFASVI